MTARCGPHYDFGAAFVLSGATSMLDLSRRTGIHSRQLYRWAHAGLNHRSADRFAVKLGWVPYVIWPEWLRVEPSSTVADWVTVRTERQARVEAEMERRRAVARATLEAVEEEAKRARMPKEPLPECPCEGCSQPFVPKSQSQRFCRMNCAEEHRRRKRAA